MRMGYRCLNSVSKLKCGSIISCPDCRTSLRNRTYIYLFGMVVAKLATRIGSRDCKIADAGT